MLQEPDVAIEWGSERSAKNGTAVRQTVWIHLASALLGLLLSSSDRATAAPEKTGQASAYQLKQRSTQLGLVTVLVGSGGLRATNEGRGYTVVSRPPKWDVIIVRPKDKLVSSMSLEKWCQPSTLLVMLTAGGWDGDFSHMPATACSVCAMPGRRYLCSYAQPMRSPKDLLVDENLVKAQRYKKKTILTVLELHVPDPAQRILQKLYGTPGAPGVPAIFENTMVDGQKNVSLTTLACTMVRAPGDAFAVPKDYRQVDPRLLIVSPDERKEFDSLGADMDVGRRFGQPKSSK